MQHQEVVYRMSNTCQRDTAANGACFPEGHFYYHNTHNGMGYMMRRLIEEMTLLSGDALDDINLNSTRLTYMYNIGLNDLRDGITLVRGVGSDGSWPTICSCGLALAWLPAPIMGVKAMFELTKMCCQVLAAHCVLLLVLYCRRSTSCTPSWWRTCSAGSRRCTSFCWCCRCCSPHSSSCSW